MVLARDKEINGTEQGAQKQTDINIANWSLTKEQRQYDGEKTVFSTNGATTPGQPHGTTTTTTKTLDTDLRLFTLTQNES